MQCIRQIQDGAVVPQIQDGAAVSLLDIYRVMCTYYQCSTFTFDIG